MSYYTVVKPCVVGKLHYATIPVQPIEVDDEVAAPLVESGDLVPYLAGQWVEKVELGAYARSGIGLSSEVVEQAVRGGHVEFGDLSGDLSEVIKAEDFVPRPKPETDDNKPRLIDWLLTNQPGERSSADLNRLTKPQLWDLINGAGTD